MTERNTRLLAAIMFTDIEGYTALMQHNEAAAVKLRDRHREIMDKFHKKHQGKIVQYYGDGSLSIFNSCVEAVKCAISIQDELKNKDPHVPLRIGVHLGDIIERDDDIIGNGVNIASRIEGLSIPGSVLISRKVADEINNHEEIKLKPMGHFSFKNSQTPTEVLAIDKETLIVPNGKLLQGKFTKRKGHEKNLINRLPTWAKYLVGLAILLLLIPISISLYNPSKGSTMHKIITLYDEEGNKVTVPIIKSKDIRRIYSAYFQNLGTDPDQDWLELGIPYALAMDWSQDPRLFNVFHEDRESESLRANLIKARTEKCDYLIQGSYAQKPEGFELIVSVYNANNGKLLDKVSQTQDGLYPLLDSLSDRIKESLKISSSLQDVIELPIEQVLTERKDAFQSLCEGIIFRSKYPRNFSRINQLLQKAVSIDSSFAWGHYYLSKFHNHHKISQPVANRHIDLAMEYRDRMPENQNAEIRQLHYRIHGKTKEALILSEFLHDSRPSNAVLLNNLIQEYYLQKKYRKTIEHIEEFRELQADPAAMIDLMTKCKIHLDESGEAIEDIEDYLRSNPSDIKAMIWLGKALLADKQIDQAASLFEKVKVLEPNKNPEIPRLLSHIEFIRDSSEYINTELFNRFKGVYWAEGMSLRSSHTIQPSNAQLYYQLEGSLSNDLMYPVSRYIYFSEGTSYTFIPNEKGYIDRMSISEGYSPDSKYLNYEVDEEILTGISLLEVGDFEAAEAEFKSALETHPQHIFIQYYLDHLNYRKNPTYQEEIQDSQDLVGTYSTQSHQYEIFQQEGTLFIQSPSNSRYIDPIPLLPLSSDTYLDTHKLTFRLRFIKENGKAQALEFLNDINKIVLAEYQEE